MANHVIPVAHFYAGDGRDGLTEEFTSMGMLRVVPL
jgi:hypothetical protein